MAALTKQRASGNAASAARVGQRSCGALEPQARPRPGASCRRCCCW